MEKKIAGTLGVLFHGMAGAGNTTCATKLALYLADTGRFTAWVWFRAPDQGRNIAIALRDLAAAFEAQLPNSG